MKRNPLSWIPRPNRAPPRRMDWRASRRRDGRTGLCQFRIALAKLIPRRLELRVDLVELHIASFPSNGGSTPPTATRQPPALALVPDSAISPRRYRCRAVETDGGRASPEWRATPRRASRASQAARRHTPSPRPPARSTPFRWSRARCLWLPVSRRDCGLLSLHRCPRERFDADAIGIEREEGVVARLVAVFLRWKWIFAPEDVARA
jgi:hypothetical protein